MLRLSKCILAGAGSAALLVSGTAFAQSGLGTRLDAQERQLTQDEQNCREVNFAEYAHLLEEASQNKQRAEKAKKKGAPVDETQINADLGKAMQLFARAQAAQARQCMMRAQGTQPQPQAQIGTGGASAPIPATGQSCTPAPTPAAASDGPRVPTQEEVSHLGQLMDDAGSLGRSSEADYVLRELDEMSAKLSKTISDAKKVGQFSNIDIKEAEKRLKQIDLYRQAGEKYRLPCRPELPKPTQTSMTLPSWAKDMLAAHNAARAAVGAPPLKWNPELQEHATARAGELAQLRQLVHAPREGRGTERENILSAPIGYSPDRMIGLWSKESQHYKPGLFPDVSDTGNWEDVAHYTQMVWAATTDIGCGIATGGGFNWVVCRYNPGGNKDGKPVIQPRLVGGDYGTERVIPTAAVFLNHDYGFDGATFVGYDLGAFRLEAEVAYKRASLPDVYEVPPPAPGGSSALNFMINGLLDFGDDDGISGFIGSGVGVARVSFNNVRAFANQGAVLDQSDIDFARQVIISCAPADTYCETNVVAPELIWAPAPPPPPRTTLDVM